MEYLVEKTKKPHKLTTDERKDYAKKIVDLFNNYDLARQKVFEYARRLQDEIYFKNSFIPKKEGKIDWKSKVKMCKMFMW